MVAPLRLQTSSAQPRTSRAAAAGLLVAALLVARFALAEPAAEPEKTSAPRVQLDRNDDAGQLRVLIDGKEAFVYVYGSDVDLPHYWPVRSPSGKSMTVEKTEPYPHHRSFWFADTVRLAGGRNVSFYSALYSGKDRKPPFRDHIRQAEFLPVDATPQGTLLRTKLVWEMDGDKPVLDELREMRIAPLGDGEYFLDVTFTVTASYGDVTFTSDAVHYAWPYVRMDPTFSVQQGGTITNSEGGVDQKGTNGKEAKWVDYTGRPGGLAEGLAIFSHPDNPQPHAWLTRDYGCFGPRRVDAKSGKPFTLAKGESIKQRVGVLVHRGDVTTGKVAERYAAYCAGKL